MRGCTENCKSLTADLEQDRSVSCTILNRARDASMGVALVDRANSSDLTIYWQEEGRPCILARLALFLEQLELFWSPSTAHSCTRTFHRRVAMIRCDFTKTGLTAWRICGDEACAMSRLRSIYGHLDATLTEVLVQNSFEVPRTLSGSVQLTDMKRLRHQAFLCCLVRRQTAWT